MVPIFQFSVGGGGGGGGGGYDFSSGAFRIYFLSIWL